MEPIVVSLTLAVSQQSTLIAAGVAGAGVLLAARVLMRRLPAGMPEGLFVAVLTGVAVIGVAVRYAPDWNAGRAHALTALAAVWLLAALVPAGEARRARVRRAVFGHAALLCGAAAGALALAQVTAAPLPVETGEPIGRGGRTGAIIDFAMLAAMAAGAAVALRQPVLWYGVAAAGAGALGIGGAAEWVRDRRDWLAPIAMLAAFGVGGALFLQGLAHWRRRSRFAVEAPQELSAPIGRPTILFAVAIAISAAVGTVFVFFARSAWAPAACLAAALSCFTVAHRRGPQFAGDVGTVLTLLAVASVVTGWLPISDGGPGRGQMALMLAGAGVALGGLHALWLAGFWHQQLHNGVAWTTAGRMIPRARRTAQAAAVGCAVLVVAAMVAGRPGVWTALFAGLLSLALALRLFRDAGQQGEEQSAGVYCAWAAAVAAAAAFGASSGVVGAAWLVLGLISVLAALRYSQPPDDPRQVAHSAWIGGILPVGLLYLGILRIETLHWTWAVTAGLLLLANAMLRRRRYADGEGRPGAAGLQD